MVEPVHTKHVQNILVANSLVDPSFGQIPLRLANITESEIELSRAMCVASCEPIEAPAVLANEKNHIEGAIKENGPKNHLEVLKTRVVRF